MHNSLRQGPPGQTWSTWPTTLEPGPPAHNTQTWSTWPIILRIGPPGPQLSDLVHLAHHSHRTLKLGPPGTQLSNLVHLAHNSQTWSTWPTTLRLGPPGPLDLVYLSNVAWTTGGKICLFQELGPILKTRSAWKLSTTPEPIKTHKIKVN